MQATDRPPRLGSVEIVHSPAPATPADAASARALWHARGLLGQLVLRDLRVRYKQAALGAAWALLVPALVVGAGAVVKLALVPAEQGSGLAAVLLKALPWGLFAGAVGTATNSLTNHQHLITRVWFPRAVLPLACLGTQLVDTALAAAVLGVALLALGAVAPTLALLWAVPLALLLVLMTAGACLLLACANLYFRDVKHLVGVLLTFGVLFTPVFFDAPDLGPRAAPLALLNPLAPVLEGLRLAVLEGHDLLQVRHVVGTTGEPFVAWHPLYLVYALLWAGPGTVGAWRLFHTLEPTFAEAL